MGPMVVNGRKVNLLNLAVKSHEMNEDGAEDEDGKDLKRYPSSHEGLFVMHWTGDASLHYPVTHAGGTIGQTWEELRYQHVEGSRKFPVGGSVGLNSGFQGLTVGRAGGGLARFYRHYPRAQLIRLLFPTTTR